MKALKKNIVSMQQVHGNCIMVVDKIHAGKTLPNCDGLITCDKNIYLAVQTADCLPISIISKEKKVVALIHAGWKGLKAGIIENTVNTLRKKFDIKPNDLRVIVGAHICVKHYEVKVDVFRYFKNIPKALVEKHGKIYLSLIDVATFKLKKMGVENTNIEIDNRCTFEDKNLPSYRRGDTKKRFVTYLDIQSC